MLNQQSVIIIVPAARSYLALHVPHLQPIQILLHHLSLLPGHLIPPVIGASPTKHLLDVALPQLPGVFGQVDLLGCWLVTHIYIECGEVAGPPLVPAVGPAAGEHPCPHLLPHPDIKEWLLARKVAVSWEEGVDSNNNTLGTQYLGIKFFCSL